MFPVAYGTLYKTPETYHQPDDASIAANTEYPNLNSRDYMKRPPNRSLRIHSTCECIAINEEHQITLAINKLSGREWNGSIWGFEDSNLVGDTTTYEAALSTSEKACFKLQCNSLISCLQYVSKNILLVSLHSGSLQVWSTRSEVRSSGKPYCMFLIGEKCEHQKPILCMDTMKADRNKAITGGKDSILKVWDMGEADLFSINTLRFAHSDVITGVDSSVHDASIFATCSLDKSALLWDDRLARPATAIYENHSFRIRTISWAPISKDKLIYIGDETGYLHSADVRIPNKFVSSVKALDRPLRKILPFGSQLAVIGDSNIVKTFDSNMVPVYENSDSQHFVRDVAWISPNQFYTVGFDGRLRTHCLQADK